MAEWDTREASPAALKTIHKYFDQAALDENYFNAVYSVLSELDFKKETTIALVNSCRDELARPISHFFDKKYGHTFNLSGIAGIITAGELGVYAATSHAPINASGRPKYVFFGSTHTAVDEHGAQGAIWREGQNYEGNACGAIEAIKGEIASGEVQTGEIRDDNVEYDILKKKVFAQHPAPNSTSTNFDITKITIKVITSDLENLIKTNKTIKADEADYAVFTGVQIHAGVAEGAPGNHLDYIAPVVSYVVIKGDKHELVFDGKKYSVKK